ncbi:TPA: hypothetical protein HA361_01380 [Candidatus Woesearchaeota archaeon]|nr:hypothetical protein [Candidatus Woesearchaeota archaeon]HII68427.1 hypothetical protein [Candidatus Woesearchaeota archaeon]
MSREHGEEKNMKRTRLLLMGLVAALLLIAVVNAGQLALLNPIVEEKMAEAKEAARPAELKLTTITTSCSNCFPIEDVTDRIKTGNVNIVSERALQSTEPEAKNLILKHGIARLPTVVAEGELEKAGFLLSFMEEGNDAFIFSDVLAPYVDAASGNVKGSVAAILLAKDTCEKCTDPEPLLTQFAQAGVAIGQQDRIDADSAEGKELIARYGIEKLPALILDQELNEYPEIAQAWKLAGSIEEDGSFVQREVEPPYYSIPDRKVKGFVDVIYLSDSSCEECYDPKEVHSQILSRMGIAKGSEEVIDAVSAKGKELVERYEIAKLPTLLLSGDVEEYPLLIASWKQVGKVANDSTYVFEAVEFAGLPYMDAATGKVTQPSQQP